MTGLEIPCACRWLAVTKLVAPLMAFPTGLIAGVSMRIPETFSCTPMTTPWSNPQPPTLNPQSSTLNPQYSALNPQPSTLNPQPATRNPQPSTLKPQP